jgi:large conductance mechanosensitive channel
MLKGFKDFLSRGNVIDLAVAVVIGTAFTALVKAFTDNVIQPLIDRVGASPGKEYGFLKISLGADKFVDLNAVVAAALNFVIVAAVIYFIIVLPYKKLRERGEVEQAQDTELSLLTEIRNLLQENNSGGAAGKHVSGPGTGPSPDTAAHTSADRD